MQAYPVEDGYQCAEEDDMKKSYSNMARQFNPDKNKHSKASDVMIMIYKAKE